jgi:hypothetical protein
MLLTYIDEAGATYEPVTERLFSNLVLEKLKISNWKATELHACDIWAMKGPFQEFNIDVIKDYFEEFFQLISKLKIPFVFSTQQKSLNLTIDQQKEESINNTKSFLLLLEHKLSELNETGLLIADKQSMENEGLLINFLDDLTKWRYSPGENQDPKYKYKFKYEAQSCFILDHLHYVDSKNSLFIQIADHIAFILQRVLTYNYLNHFGKRHPKFPKPDSSKIPITVETFEMFASNGVHTLWDLNLGDIRITAPGIYLKNSFDYFSKEFIEIITPTR